MLFFGRGNGKRKFSFIALFNDERRIQSGALPNFCDDLKNYNDTFLLSYFSVTKSTKSHQRERSPLFENSSRVHELVARAMRGKCVRQMAERKSAVLRSPQSKLYHACEHITRKSRADSCTHCLHARWIMGGAGVGLASALTEWKAYLLFCLLVVLGLCA